VTSVGWSAQFGLPIRGGAARAAFESLRGYQHIEPVGLHLHLGTGIKDVSSYLRAITEILDFADELKADLGIQISFFDLGGGFGIPTVGTLSATDRRLIAAGYPSSPIDVSLTPRIEEFADPISNLFVRRFGPADESSPLLFFEPGRVLTGNAQVLLLSVLAIKPGPNGRQNIILDGGRNVAFPPNYEYHEVFPVAGYNRPVDQMCSFFGPLCHPGDVLFQNRPMPSLRVGDVIAMMDAGAYFIPNQMNFSNPRAAAVIVRDDVAKLSRARERFEDIVALDDLSCGNLNAIDSAEPRRIGRVG
jgi:diaminopimelate decarboxylase